MSYKPLRIAVLTYLCQAAMPAAAQSNGSNDEYVFDTRLFRGRDVSKSLLERFNEGQSVLPGTYGLGVWLNQNFVERLDIELKENSQGRVAPCFTVEQAQRLGILLPESNPELAEQVDKKQAAPDDLACFDIAQRVPGASAQLRIDVFRLDVQVPQVYTRQIPRGYVNPADLDPGTNVSFINYMGNYYHLWQQDSPSQGSAYMSFRAGANLGLWQLRHVSNVNWSQSTDFHWRNSSIYVQRPLFSIASQLTLGQAFTQGQFFPGLNYIGMRLAQDDRMLPDSQQGYAPIVRGVANSNARVSIRQNDQEIYQTTVPQGAFAISDLYPNSNSGDLEVEILESDGSVVRYTVPYASVPESLREGNAHYELSLGRTYKIGKDSAFADLTYQRGISNAVTLYGGLRLAQSYQAVMAGGVYASRIGALGSDLTWTRAKLLGRNRDSGWMLRFSYSNTIISTGTNITLANYYYSTTGYQELANVLLLRNTGIPPTSSSSWQQHNRLDLRLSQEIGRWGSIFISGAMQNYHGGRPRDIQYQFGYSKALQNGLSFNVILMRQHMSAGLDRLGRRETTVMLAVNIPLGQNLPSINSTYSTGSGSSSQITSSFGGMLDEAQTVNYSLGASYDKNARQTVTNGSLSKRFSALLVGVSGSRSRNTRQASMNVQGAAVAHAGGVTFGQYLSDTFGLVQAPGAKGAKVYGGQSEINRDGYALLPSMTPYRYNRVTLDPGGMSAAVELLDGEQRSAPYAGAVVKLVFNTRRGQALLIRTVKSDGLPIPFGAEVFNESGVPLGMVGQGGRIYVRAEAQQGQLTVRWGNDTSEQCLVPYQIDITQKQDQPLMRLEGVCGSI